MSKTESSSYDDFPDNTDVMWMKMALMAASRAEVSEYAEGKPSVGCVIRRSRNRGPPAVLAVGWNGFLPNTPEEEIAAIQGRSFKGQRAAKDRDKALTAELGLHAEVDALQYCSERPEMATIYTTHVPCYNCAKQLVAHKVGRVFYLFWMKDSETSIALFKKFDITCGPFGRRDEVLKDFNMPVFLTKRKIVEGRTVAQTFIEPNQYFLDCRDNGDRHLKEVENHKWGKLDLTTQERDEEETRCYDDFPDNSDVMWMKMTLMAASRAEIPRETEDMPSVGCVIRRARTRGSPAVLAVGWNGFLPNTPEKELNEIKGRSFKKPNEQQKRDNSLTAELGLHAETNALQYCSETPEKATVYVTHLPCYKCAKQLVAHKVGRVFYLYWMTYPDADSETTMSLFEKFGDISCIAFSKRDKVLEDFGANFLGLRGIVRGNTDDKTPPESCLSFLDSRDRKQTT